MNMKFDYGEAEDAINQITKAMTSIYNELVKAQTQFEAVTKDYNSWTSPTCDYVSKKLKDVYDDISNVDAIHANVEAYLDAVLANYKAFDDSTSGFFDWW